MKSGSNSYPLLPEKTTFKNSSLIRVKGIFTDTTNTKCSSHKPIGLIAVMDRDLYFK